MTSVEALKIALEIENNGIKLYTEMESKLPEISELLLFLINQEEKHKKLIEEKIAAITSS